MKDGYTPEELVELYREKSPEEEEKTDLFDEYRSNVLVSLKPSNSETLTTESKNLVSQIIAEQDSDKLKDLTNLFEMNQRKKNIARMDRLSDILEMVDDEVITRLATTPGSMEDKDLINYMKVAQSSMSSIKQSMDNAPLIQINNQTNEIHLDNSDFDLDSRKRILDAAMSILSSVNVEDLDEIEVEDE